jgi:hypothetical protein
MGICAKTYCKRKRLSQESSPKSSPKSSPNLVQSSVYNMPWPVECNKEMTLASRLDISTEGPSSEDSLGVNLILELNLE